MCIITINLPHYRQKSNIELHGFFNGDMYGEKVSRPKITYIDLLIQDTGLEEPDIKTAMLDRRVWRAITVRANVST